MYDAGSLCDGVFQRPYDVIPVLLFCHPSSPFFVIPVPRTGIQEKDGVMQVAPIMSSQRLLLLSPQCSFLVIRVAPFLLSQCPDTGSLYNGSAPFLSSQCLFLCHPSAQTLG
ncbi:hypothetical protein [Wolbachia endosymbiont (group A) of Tiphia femorata]|uniref:hypothetical protein n=1 Tax=Wolbachia endosymbiont (group A) of Tiphia femorata TaxID=2954063 RepID=UPI002231D223|nr:hypothetical protein [Wolbachia endosymbiont (group A) of Tiphia femorata]